MENQKSFFIAAILIVGALYTASLVDPQTTGRFEFYVHDPEIEFQPVADANGLSVLGIKEEYRKINSNLDRIKLRRWGGGPLYVYGDPTENKDILAQIEAIPNGKDILLTHLEKETNWRGGVWVTADTTVSIRERTRSTQLTRG